MKPWIGAVCALILSFSLGAEALASDLGTVDSHIRGLETNQVLINPHLRKHANLPPTLVPGVFQQNVDHSGAMPGQTFSQRYWVESSYASSASAPVLFHICGEGDCTEDYFLNDNAVAWAKTMGAFIVYLEHRYYGQSLPFPDLSTDHLQYLTVQNVIEDLATFQKWVTQQKGWTGKWISLGGSYSGTVSALYRQAHPELVVGALASSAPMISGVGNAIGTQSDLDEISSTVPTDAASRQWTYQACASLGYWQAEGADINSALDLPSSWLCNQAFGGAPQVNPTIYNQNYDLPFISNIASAPGNIFFTDGSEDVWTRIGLLEQTNANPGITLLMIEDAGHHFDLNPPASGDSNAVIQARDEFVTLAQKWLAL